MHTQDGSYARRRGSHYVPEKGNKELSFNKLASINDVNEFIRRIIYAILCTGTDIDSIRKGGL